MIAAVKRLHDEEVRAVQEQVRLGQAKCGIVITQENSDGGCSVDVYTIPIEAEPGLGSGGRRGL